MSSLPVQLPSFGYHLKALFIQLSSAQLRNVQRDRLGTKWEASTRVAEVAAQSILRARSSPHSLGGSLRHGSWSRRDRPTGRGSISIEPSCALLLHPYGSRVQLLGTLGATCVTTSLTLSWLGVSGLRDRAWTALLTHTVKLAPSSPVRAAVMSNHASSKIQSSHRWRRQGIKPESNHFYSN